MVRISHTLAYGFSVLVLLGLLGCKQEAPSEKAKSSGGSAVESAGQAAVDYLKTPMDDARQAEGKLEKSAEETAAAIKKSTQ